MTRFFGKSFETVLDRAGSVFLVSQAVLLGAATLFVGFPL